LALILQDFYEKILKPKLAPGGIIVTQGGPAGILSYKLVSGHPSSGVANDGLLCPPLRNRGFFDGKKIGSGSSSLSCV
jgi:hypothetical protein